VARGGSVIHYHGTPITPRSTLYQLAGRHFCVSFADPRDVKVCHEIGQSVMLDNGAFTFWRGGASPDWPSYMDWAEPWLDYPTTWAVIPDVIDGDEDANDRLLVSWFQRRLPKGAPVWHLHESLERLRRLTAGYERVCFGSSGQYRIVGSVTWTIRISEAFDTVASERGVVPWIHMLRGMRLSGLYFPFASVDSTDIARNHNRLGNTARAMAGRWDGKQTPGRWASTGQQLGIPAPDYNPRVDWPERYMGDDVCAI
jgi:hypothetical protein